MKLGPHLSNDGVVLLGQEGWVVIDVIDCDLDGDLCAPGLLPTITGYHPQGVGRDLKTMYKNIRMLIETSQVIRYYQY